MSQVPDLSALQAFVSVVDAGSVTRAAANLGIARTTLSRRLDALEESLGVRLIRRTTRSLHITDAGASMYHHAREALDAAARAVESVRFDESAPLRGSLSISLPPQVPLGFQNVITQFATRHPEVTLKLDFGTRFVDLQRDHYDVAIRAGQDFEPGLVARTLFRTTHVLVGSPDYLARRGRPEHLSALETHRCLVGFSRGETPQTHWPLRDGGKVAVVGSVLTNDLRYLCALARAGQGLALLPALLVDPLLERGELVTVLEDQIGADVRIALVFHDRELLPMQVRVFIDMLTEWIASQKHLDDWQLQGTSWEEEGS